MNYSFWEKYFVESPSDITIIGSGIVGLSTAISIKEINPDLTVKILERGSHPNGASTKNAGFSCFGSVSELLDDISLMGEETCMEIVKMRWMGLQKLKTRVGENLLEYQDCGGTELFRHRDKDLKDMCLASIGRCNEWIGDSLGIKDTYRPGRNTTLPGFDDTGIYNKYEGTINPVSMMQALIRIAYQKDIKIIYGIDVNDIDKENHLLTTTDHLRIGYKKLIVCTNGFARRLFPDLDVFPARNQVLITTPLKNNPLSSGYHLDKGYIYFRQYHSRILLGGGRNIDQNTEATDMFGNTELIKDYLMSILETIYPGASDYIAQWWSGILGIGETKVPLIQWYDGDILVGVRLGGMGVAIGSWMGERLADEVILHN